MAITIDLGTIILILIVAGIAFGVFYMIKKKRASSSDINRGYAGYAGKYGDISQMPKPQPKMETMDDLIAKLRTDMRTMHKQNVELFKSFDYFLNLLQKQRKTNDGVRNPLG